MRKIYIFLTILLFLVSCWTKKQVEIKDEKNTQTQISQTWSSESEDEKNYVIENKKERFEISQDDVQDAILDPSKISNERLEKSPILKNWVNFLKDLKNQERIKVTDRIDGWIEYSDFEKSLSNSDQKYLREKYLELKIIDKDTKQPVKSGQVYLNNIKFWEFKNWEFTKEFKWPLWIERFVVMVRADWYGDAFSSLNTLYNDGAVIYQRFSLKKSIEKNISLDHKEAKIWNLQKDDFALDIPKCSLVDSTWKCFRWEVKVKSHYISWEDVNSADTSLNMRAITKEWKYSKLYSWWMAFNDFITKDWEILKLWDGKKFKVIYKLTDEMLKEFSDIWKEKWEYLKSGYWWYDKNAQIWREWDWIWYLDKENKTWTVETEYLY